jgi:MFS family permease
LAAALRSNPSLSRLLGAWLQSCLGSGIGYVALLVLVLRDVHTSWAVPAVLLADFVPAVALGTSFGLLADRFSKRLLAVGANLVQAAAWAGLVFSHSAASIIGLALLSGVGNALLRPALRSALPIVAGEAAQAAAAWYDACRWIGITVGPIIAAGLFAALGLALPLALNAVSFLVAAAVLATVAVAPTPRLERGEPNGAAGGLRSGLAVAFGAPGIAVVIITSACAVIGGGLLNVCEPLLAKSVLHGSNSDYALLVASYGAGMVAATAWVARNAGVVARVLIHRYVDAQILFAAGIFASAIVGSVLPAAFAFAATGFGNALVNVSEIQLIQLRVPGSVQGRLFGAKDTLEGAAYLIGLVGAGVLVATEGVRVTLAIAAGICGVCGLAAAAALRPRTPPQGLVNEAGGGGPRGCARRPRPGAVLERARRRRAHRPCRAHSRQADRRAPRHGGCWNTRSA